VRDAVGAGGPVAERAHAVRPRKVWDGFVSAQVTRIHSALGTEKLELDVVERFVRDTHERLDTLALTTAHFVGGLEVTVMVLVARAFSRTDPTPFLRRLCKIQKTYEIRVLKAIRTVAVDVAVKLLWITTPSGALFVAQQKLRTPFFILVNPMWPRVVESLL
jgi:hypothetical protein